MKKESFSFPSHDGKNTISGCIWLPEGEMRGMVQLLHGMQEYIARYDAFAQYLTEQGLLVFGHDHLGHGETAAPEDRGYMGDVDGYLHMLEDAHTATLLQKEAHPGLPVVMIAHSMGSMIARMYLAKYAGELAGMILSGVTQKVPALPLAKWLMGREVKKQGYRGTSPLAEKLVFGKHNTHFEGEGCRVSWLTRDAAVREAYLADPLCTFPFTAAAYTDLMHMAERIFSPGFYASVPHDIPVLLAAGAEDPCGGYGKGVEREYEKLLSTGANVSLKLYPDMRHEILNEIGKEAVWADFLEFIEKCMG